MEEGTITSLMEGNEIAEPQWWTKDLNGLPTFTYEILTKHLSKENSGAGSQKYKKLGYQMFKDKYVGKVEAKANVVKGNMSCFLVKGCVNAAMKSSTYTVYAHLNQTNGDVVHSNCTCAAGKGGECKHIVALLFQIIEYKQLDMTEIPDHLTCTQYYCNNGMCQEKMNLMTLFCMRTLHLRNQTYPRQKTKKKLPRHRIWPHTWIC